jgi:LEA14-like dessication related protein
MKKSWIYIVLIGGAIAYFYGKRKLQQSIKFSFESLKLSGTKIIVRLGMLNPSGSSATLNSLVGSLIVKGNEVATIENFTKTIIAPKSKSFIDVTITPSALGVLTTLKNLFKKGGIANLSAQIVGNANIDGITMPIDVKYII